MMEGKNIKTKKNKNNSSFVIIKVSSSSHIRVNHPLRQIQGANLPSETKLHQLNQPWLNRLVCYLHINL